MQESGKTTGKELDLTASDNVARLYQGMINEVKDYAILFLDTSGNIIQWNKGAENIKGYTSAEILGKNFRIFYTQDDRDQKLPEMLIDLAHRKGTAVHEGWRVRKDGTKFWGSITITALHDSASNTIGFSKVTRDLTERKLAEDSLRLKNAQLEEVNAELSAMNKELISFAYISSHDLQEPLRKIQTFSSRIIDIDAANLSEKGIEYFRRIQTAAQRMRLLIDDLLTYSRADTAERRFESVDATKIIEEVYNDLEPNIEESKATIHWQQLPQMDVIPFQFHQLLFNIINNSIKFARPGVPPEISISYELVAANMIPGNTKRTGEVFHHIFIADNGIGFEQEHATRIFEIFQRLHGRNEYTGTGVGLAICKKIVDNHFGFIRAEGHPDKGSVFHIYLPTTHEKTHV